MFFFVVLNSHSWPDFFGCKGLSIVEGRSLGGDVEKTIFLAELFVDAGVDLLDVLAVGILFYLITVLDGPVDLLTIRRVIAVCGI